MLEHEVSISTLSNPKTMGIAGKMVPLSVLRATLHQLEAEVTLQAKQK
jgi:hypothetical protein